MRKLLTAATVAAAVTLGTIQPAAAVNLDPSIDWHYVTRQIDWLVSFLGIDEVPLTAGQLARRNCESGHNYAVSNPSGKYLGAWQFDQRTWDHAAALAGYGQWVGEPANEAPRHVQDRAMLNLEARRGRQPWPECGKLG